MTAHPVKFIALLITAGTLAACQVGPNYQRPDLRLPNQYKGAQTADASGVPVDWWTLFGDDTLTTLENAAIVHNPDVQAAMARVTQARQAARSVESQFYPTITADPSFSRTRASAAPRNNGGSGGGGWANTYSIPFDLSHEVDVWGRVARAVESARATARASAADYAVILQTLQADVAQDYFTLRALDAQIDILNRGVELYQRQIDLLQIKNKAGILTPSDLPQAQAQLESTRSTLIDTRRQRDDIEHALALLTGQAPSELAVQPVPDAAQTLPDPPQISPGLPGELLRRRPDVAEAEQNLAAANADVAERIAEFYPRFTLTSATGFESFDTAHLLNWQSALFSITPSVFIPIFEGGRLNANLAQARARYVELYAAYRKAVLSAITDVETSLTDLHRRADQSAAQAAAVAASREYLRLSEIQYRQGIIAYLQVIDADRTLLSNELTAIQVQQQRLIATVLLAKSIGGGWSPAPSDSSQVAKN